MLVPFDIFRISNYLFNEGHISIYTIFLCNVKFFNIKFNYKILIVQLKMY